MASALFTRHGIHGLFSLRTGGINPAAFDSQNIDSQDFDNQNLDSQDFAVGDNDNNISANLNHFIQQTGLPNTPHQAIQSHQTQHLWCKGNGYMHASQADILLTANIDTAVAVRTADCLPILLADPQTGIIAAVHAGWRGTAAGVVRHAVQIMQSHGATTAHIIASLGPCIESCCFNIGSEAAVALQQSAKGAEEYVDESADLRQINRLQLLECGIYSENLECIKACTACDDKHFFSFRRDAGITGRHIAVVAIASKP